MAHLKLVTDLSKPQLPKESILAAIHTGCRYHVGCQDLYVLNSTHGVIGDYRISAKCAEILPVAPVTTTGEMNTCCFWDTDIDLSQLRCYIMHYDKGQLLALEDCNLKANRLVLNRAELNGPELAVSNEETVLTLSPQFEFTFSTDSYAAQLGVINLVQSTRFITLENSDEIHLLDTADEETPVLYLENPLDDQPVKFVVQQERGATRQHTFGLKIAQPIPDEIGGERVETVTVLEQYSSYFMQCALPLDNHHDIWIPVYAPISWGWSIRVGRRTDGQWGILRRKLILPTTGHDGLQLPAWRNNTIECSLLEIRV